MGKFDGVDAYLKVPVPDAMFRTPFGARYLQARGRYFLAVGHPHAALNEFLALGECIDRWALHASMSIPWQVDAAPAHLALGQVREARALLKEVFDDPAWKTARPRGRGIALRALATTQQPKDALVSLREAVELLQGCGDRLELARAYVELGRVHRLLGEYSAGRAMEDIVDRLAEQCGAQGLRQTADQERSTTADTVGLSDDGPLLQLSDAQRRVAELAACGYTNRQIAARLFITVSTVEQHLTRVYRTLKVKRRSELADRLQQVPRVEETREAPVAS